MDDSISTCTIIITTSPIPSNPHLDIISKVFECIEKDNFLCLCPIIIVCDGYQQWEKNQWKSSRITQEAARRYEEFQTNLYSRLGLSEKQENGDETTLHFQLGTNTFSNARVRIDKEKRITVISHSIRCGFALAVKSGLEFCETEVVLIHQHDWILNANLPLEALVNLIIHQQEQRALNDEEVEEEGEKSDPINYIGFITRKNLLYNDNFSGKLFQSEIRKSGVVEFQSHSSSNSSADETIPLTRLYFYYDRPHLARTSFLKSFVFGNQRFKRGDFIEDKFGHVVMDEVKQMGLAGWRKYALWMYYPDQGQTIAIRHLNGRKFMSYTHPPDLVIGDAL
jgi:hypothetical protein